ncbi:hypothetical protein [Nocardia sp. NPDC057227]|uniref:hypothetical protein n=1 Tax=Nocardia sp. NPDC057227 TaxID=3346056 RepID=UPI0036457AC7
MAEREVRVPLLFSDHFGVSTEDLQDYGAFDICLLADLPLFIDPFLLFESSKTEYQKLHTDIIEYLKFLRSKAGSASTPGLLKAWYTFGEVEQNWLGFSLSGNSGHGLGKKFATSLHKSLGDILHDFGSENITKGSHLEKLTLIESGVGRDTISDFTTNLIKEYLLNFTQKFARDHIDETLCEEVSVDRVSFNYKTERWAPGTFFLPKYLEDFVLLTPTDMLTRDETWISHTDMVKSFSRLPVAVPDNVLRDTIRNYFYKQLEPNPTQAEKRKAAEETIKEFPELVDYYIKLREQDGQKATAASQSKVDEALDFFVRRLRGIANGLSEKTDFFEAPFETYEEALARTLTFKRYVENEDGYLLLNKADRRPYKERDVQILFTALWKGTSFDVNREVNNGRGPVDFKVSYGAKDSSLLELKLASNTHLRRNLENQVEIYKAANNTDKAIKIIVCYTKGEQEKVKKILEDLQIAEEESVVVIDARNDNKQSASTV